MTSKTKYIVIVLLLVALASTSVGLSTWNIHYQANVGTIDYYQPTDPSTVDSLLNDYVYFDKTADGTAPTTTNYPIGLELDGSVKMQENTFTYVYDGEIHTPAVFAPVKDANNAQNNKQKGDENYPESLFLNNNVVDTGWGLGEAGGIFSEITFKREYRLVALPYVSDDKGNSDNYCEISSIAYFEDAIDVYLTWKNGNGNHKGANVVVHFVKENGVFVPYLLGDDGYAPYSNVQNSKIQQASYDSATQTLTVQVNGFSAFDINASSQGWTETAPSDAGVWQCRFTAVKATLTSEKQAYYNALTAEEKVAFDNASNEAIALLNTLGDGAYAAQVTYAIVPYQTEMADLEENSFTYAEKSSAVKTAPHTNLTKETMPLANESTETLAESGLMVINGNNNSFFVTYNGASFEVQIASTFEKLDGSTDNEVIFSTELSNIAKNLKNLENIGSEYYTAYGFSSDHNYQISNPVVHYTIVRREITINSWTEWANNSTVYDGTPQSPVVTSNTNTYGAEWAYSWTNGTQTFTTAPKDAGSYTVSVFVAGEGASNYFLSCVEGAGTLDESGDIPKVNWTYEITPKEVGIDWSNTDSLVYNGATQAPTATATDTIDGDTVNVTVTGGKVNAGTGYTATASSLDNPNYKLPKPLPTTTFQINKVSVTKPAENTAEFVYNGTVQTYSLTTNNAYTISNNTRKDAGSQTVTLALNDTTNYEWTDGTTTDLPYTFTIAPKQVGITWDSTSLTYKGQNQVPTATVNASDLCTVNGTLDTCTVNVTATGDTKNVGANYTATASSLSNSNYKLPDTKPTTSFDITQKSVTLTWENTLLTYNGSAQSPTATSKDIYSIDDCTIVVDGQGTTVGQYDASATLVGTDAGNYKLSKASTTFKIAQAPNAIIWTTTPGWTYGETPVPAEATAQFGGNVTITYYTTYDSNAQSYSGEIAFEQIVNAGKYYVVATSESDPEGNYFGMSQDIAGGFVVAKAENTITFADGFPKGWTYGSKPTSETEVVSATALEGTVTFTFYTDSDCTTAIAFANIVNAGTYYVKAVSADGTNRYASSAVKPFAVAQAPLKITADNKTVTYGDAVPTYTVTYSGFVNGETESVLSGTLSISCSYQPGTQVGTSPSITLSGLTSSNYNIRFYNGKVTINPIEISLKDTDNILEYAYGASNATSIIANAQSNANITYGTVSAVLTITYTDGKTTYDVNSTTYETISVGNTYRIDYKLNDTKNYVWASGSGIVIDNTNTNIRSCYYKYQTAKIGDDWYTVEDAIAQANSTATSSTKVQIVFAGNHSTESSYIVTSFTLLQDATNLPNCTGSFTLNYIEFVVPHTATLSWGSDKWVDVSTPTASSGNVYAAVQVPQGISLTFNNGSVLAVTAALGYKDNWTRACNRGVLVNDGDITIESGASVYAYGYIKSGLTYNEDGSIAANEDNAPVTTGKITAKSGATVVEAMTLFDYPGGNSVSKIMDNAFPSNAWVAHNISCTLQINAGSTYQGYVMVVANDSVQSTFATILGANNSVQDCFFKPTEISPNENTNYIVKSTRPARTWTQSDSDYLALYTITGSNSIVGQRDTFEIYGSYTDDLLTVSVSGQTLKTSSTISAPIGYMDMIIKSGTVLSLTSSDYMILPGSKVIIEQNATVTVGANIDLALIDLATMEGWLSVSDSNKSFNLYCVDKQSAYAVVNGTLTVNGSIGGEIQTVGSNATLNLASATSLSASYNTMTGSYGAKQDLFGSNTYYCSGKSKALFGEIITDTLGESSGSGSFDKAQYKAYNGAWYKTSTSNTISYVLNDGSGTITTASVQNGTATTLITPTRTGYTFVGWRDSQGNMYDAGYHLTLFANITLTAQWSIDSYTITVIDENGNQLNSVTREYGTKYGNALPQLTKEGYLLSWNIVGTETFVTTDDTVAIGNHTIQAVWEEQSAPVEITFKDSKGGNADILQTLNGGSTFSSLPTITRTGYTFAGWYTEDGSQQITVGSTIPETSTTYYAHWTINSYTITFNTDGGSAISPIIQNYGTNITVPANPTKTGHTFAGWDVSIPSTMPAENIVVTATWTINQYTITFDANGGTFAENNSSTYAITRDYGSAVAAPGNPTRSGYTFNGWNATIPSTMPAGSQTITAQWTKEDSGGLPCIAAGTLITMADGSTKKVENLVAGDIVLVFNHYKGEYEFMPVIYNVHHYEDWAYYDILYLYFDDGTVIKTHLAHCFLDMETMRYEEIRVDNVDSYVGHSFYAADFDGITYKGRTIKLTGYKVVNEYTGVYGPITYGNLNCFAEGLLNIPADNDPFINTFVMNSNLKYDEELMAQDIDTYGLYTYEDFRPYISEDIYYAYNGQYIKVAVGKGHTTFDRVLELIEKYLNDMGYGDQIPSTSQPTTTDGVDATLPPAVVTGDEDVVEEETTE